MGLAAQDWVAAARSISVWYFSTVRPARTRTARTSPATSARNSFSDTVATPVNARIARVRSSRTSVVRCQPPSRRSDRPLPRAYVRGARADGHDRRDPVLCTRGAQSGRHPLAGPGKPSAAREAVSALGRVRGSDSRSTGAARRGERRRQSSSSSRAAATAAARSTSSSGTLVEPEMFVHAADREPPRAKVRFLHHAAVP